MSDFTFLHIPLNLSVHLFKRRYALVKAIAWIISVRVSVVDSTSSSVIDNFVSKYEVY
ncbi:MAG: hypothetical protein PT120_07580 [Aphanizomenon gracile PMC649.10]|nr:hypothetical protein [Aphanizomenon gracile PMC649.10]MDM3859238.1 hypothetical protein [Aphanizomenon gracile PMC644.10]